MAFWSRKTVTATPADILKALERVTLPASGQSLPRSGRLTDIVVNDGKAMFAIRIDPTEAAAMEPVRVAAQEAAAAVAGVTQALVALTADKAPTAQAARPPEAQARSLVPRPAG